ncbi:MAG: pilus (MSHA type) biogenesis protein MshL [Methylotenera sp.]|nr:pilus (MSHA type) biogenesis protein MshL [Methylotenera sp.]HOY87710.1 pilus (MSHA type) biogenesis protein MshL [Methylotenera sp.]HPH08415.1 pilus (MSHA type) biogenesis protein MshL [Methylotenera sp.]HPM50259.1 pilus (MSHA type) biogenesis protein MshL [Methylotenera sp.]HPV32198.1 pilus (MSHA type) biogenesis protein MshL [Methylotenera sp.]
MTNNIRITLLACVALALASCAHESKVQPSSGHIDGQNDSASQPNVAVTNVADIPKPITKNTYLPPPKAKAKEPVYSIVVYDTPVREVLFAIARDSKFNVDIHPNIKGNVTLNAVDQTLPAILERISKQVDLTYKIQNNVLTIAPDQPVLRTYKVDYVNMSRDTTSFIGADGQISSASQSSGANGTISNSAGNGANNSSRTSVTSESKSHFWETLEKNLKDILAETDKEVLITRSGSSSKSNTKSKAGQAGKSAEDEVANVADLKSEREEDRNEFKTLFAGTVIVNREAGIINVRATNKQHEKIQDFIDKVMSSARRQVLIEATIVEVRLNDSFQAGIDWSRFGNTATSSGFTFQQSLGPSINPASNGFAIGYLNPVSSLGNLAASVTLLKQFGDTKVISSPKLMVLNNQTAILKVVDNIVYFTVQAQQSQATQGGVLSTVTTTPNTVPVGIVMSVTPQINENSAVNINVRPTISRVVSFVRDPNPQLANIASQVPQIQVREMESLLQVNSGNTAILGGLMQDEIQRNTDKVPGLSDIKGFGEIFKGRDYANKKTELVIFLRPTVVKNASLESDELSRYKQYLPSSQLQQTLEVDGER